VGKVKFLIQMSTGGTHHPQAEKIKKKSSNECLGVEGLSPDGENPYGGGGKTTRTTL